MPSFRNSRDQAAHAVKQNSAIGASRHHAKDDGKLHSIGTCRNHSQSLKGTADWLHETRGGRLADITRQQAIDYLDMRACGVRQSTLDLDRQALQTHIGEALPRIKSEVDTHRGSRMYSAQQLDLIRCCQTPKNALTTELALHGLRAHEAYTIERIADQPPSKHREWMLQILAAANYTVRGKGGLCRPVIINNPEVVERLEATRRSVPVTVTDRGIRYQSRYDIGGGNAWSKSFSEASKRALGYSLGGHSCRHVFVQTTLKELSSGRSPLSPGVALDKDEARAIVMNLVGHWRDICEAYLR